MALKQQHKANKTATNNMKMGLNYDSFLVRNTNREFASFSISGTTNFESLNKEYTKFTALRRGPRKYVAACFFFCMTINKRRLPFFCSMFTHCILIARFYQFSLLKRKTPFTPVPQNGVKRFFCI